MTSITDSSPYIPVACRSLQVTWLNVALEEICFDVVDEAFLWTTSWTLSRSELAVEQPPRQPVVRHSDNMPQPSQLFLEEQVFSRSYSSFLEELSLWYFLPPSDAKDVLQTADVKCLEGRDVSSIEGLCLTTVQHNWDTDCPVNGHFSGYSKAVIEEDKFCQSAEGRWSSFNMVLDFAVQAAAVTYMYIWKGIDAVDWEGEQADREWQQTTKLQSSLYLQECYEWYSNHIITRISIQTAGLAFGGNDLCSYRVSRVRNVDGSSAKHLTVESYTVIYAANSHTCYY